MKTLQKILGIGILSCALYACGNNQESQSENYHAEYNTTPIEVTNTNKFATLEGKIIKVQPSSIEYIGEYQGGYSSYSTGNHEFEYVLLKDSTNKVHTLIYPYSKAILDTTAKIQYRIIDNNTLSSEKFIQLFLNKEYRTDDNFLIETEGVIVKDGILYKK